ncbi:hypothetical protein Hanom_Chr06g00573301 [Helianthus anomalus]
MNRYEIVIILCRKSEGICDEFCVLRDLWSLVMKFIQIFFCLFIECGKYVYVGM